ncbi:hypothetical protein KBY74_11295, partial [Cyanobium sp. A1C-AMD]|uniref:hypothetical protein n=1 Tax=Cyanobium sp. A1C-AMD TaxID=2823694 RepID=UPI0020CB84DF
SNDCKHSHTYANLGGIVVSEMTIFTILSAIKPRCHDVYTFQFTSLRLSKDGSKVRAMKPLR